MTKLSTIIIFLNKREVKLRAQIQGPINTHDRRSCHALTRMYFCLDPGSTYEASLQQVQENKTQHIVLKRQLILVIRAAQI